MTAWQGVRTAPALANQLCCWSYPRLPSFFERASNSRVFRFAIAANDVTKLLKDSGVEVDKANLTIMMEKLSGKSIPELIAEGQKELASMPAGGAAAPAGAAAAAEAAPAEAKKEEEPEEDVDMGDLFGGGDDDY